jgi:hypothetical protein
MKNLDSIDAGSINIGDLIRLFTRLQQVPLLQRLTFTLHVNGQQTFVFRLYDYFSPRVELHRFPKLKDIYIIFEEGSDVRQVYRCHDLREAFKAYTGSDIITFAHGLETFDGPPDA